MSILSNEDILSRIQNPKLEALINRSRVESKHLNMHVNGLGVQEYLQRIENYENKKQAKLRKKLARSMRFFYASLVRPIDKVFSAKGGSTFYDLPDSQQQNFREILADVGDGKSIRGWLDCFWRQNYITDPNGLTFIEVDETGRAFLTVKTIWSIYDYEIINGQKIGYVIFEPFLDEKGNKIYRVVDDQKDILVRVQSGSNATFQTQSDTLIIIDEFPQFFDGVPAVINSNIIDNVPVKIDKDSTVTEYKKTSLISESLEIADEYLRDMSIHSIYKFLHGYPVFWRYNTPCPACQSAGMIEGEVCTTCNGTRYLENKDVSDVITLKELKEGDPALTPPAGYVQPDLGTWEQQNVEMTLLGKSLEISVWGTHTRDDDAAAETATSKFINTQPVNERLNTVSIGLEIVETILTDLFGTFYFESSYNGSSISTGRRFQIETPDELYKKYTEARASGAPRSTLDFFLVQFYQAEFAQDTIMQQSQIKMLRVEPWVHLSELEVRDLGIDEVDYLRKIYYNEWAQTLLPNQIIFTEQTKLSEQLNQFIQSKKLKEDEKAII